MTGYLLEHRTHPDVSLDEHRARRVSELARVVLKRRRVYLDTRYWIFLRDAAAGRPQKPIHVELLRTLRSGVHSGALLCPCSDSAFFEILKQTDRDTRLATARLIDALSLGITIQNARDRLRTELVRFLFNTVVHQTDPGPPIEHVWVKIGHVLGTAHPVFSDVDPQENLAIAKAFFDVMWQVTLEELLTDTPLPRDSMDLDFQNIAARTTDNSAAHMAEMKNFKSVYLAEIRGFFEVHAEAVQAALQQMIPPDAPMPTEAQAESQSRLFTNVFSNIFKYEKAGTSLPTAQIVSGLYAVIRWHYRQRPFDANDFYDFYHAAAALPYCDYFLTEQFLGTALTTPPLSLGKHFGTTVVWEEASAIEALRRAAHSSR